MILIDYIVLALYFIAMIAIGLWSMGKVKGQEDYFLGGRKFGKILQTFAAFGAGTGAHEPVTVGRTCWTSGLSGVWSALMWLFVTPIYWLVAVWYRRMRHLTLGDWFVERYQSKGLGAAYSVFAIVFYMFFISTMLSAIAKFAVPLMGVDSINGIELKYILVPLISVIVILYGVLGGLTAAYYTDLIQGVFIILLSVLLIPFGLLALVREFGDPATMGVMDGFKIMHERVPADFFQLFSGPSAGEFPVQYIVSLTILVMVGIVVQPHFIAIGGGSAKSEDEARFGIVIGNFLKRFCTVGWAITALIALALLAGSPEIVADPDQVWGVAAREILGPLKLGLVGLMFACLMAAMMSSADCYMLTTSGLITRNIYQSYINPDASEKTSLRVARATGLIIIVGASYIAIAKSDVFGQFKLAVELPILFAAPFWVGMWWRRANRTAVWVTLVFSLLFFFILPALLPKLAPSLRTHPSFTAQTNLVTKTFTRQATAADVAKHEAWVAASTTAKQNDDQELVKKIGPEPPLAPVGQPIEITMKSGGKSIFWRDGFELQGDSQLTEVSKLVEAGTATITQRETTPGSGKGIFNLDFLIYHLIGVDLSTQSKAMIETLRLPPRVLFPFLILILVSLFTARDDKEKLDRYYSKMQTEVDPDPEKDLAKIEAAYQSPENWQQAKLFPNTDWEIPKPTAKDIFGFLAAVGGCILILGLLVWLASIGS